MGNKVKKMLAFVLAVVMCLCAMPMGENMLSVTVSAATFDEINSSDMFFMQNTSTTCTLSSAAMMVRRYARLRGDSNWRNITESSMRSTAWKEGVGLYFNFTYSNISVSHDTLSASSSNASFFIDMLANHPEGIVVYNGSHAILLTDYTNGTFYCSDPARFAGRRPISGAYSVTIANIKAYWYVTSAQVYIDGKPSSNFEFSIDTGISEGQTFNYNGTMSLSGWAFNTDGSTTSVVYCFDDGMPYTFNKHNRDDVVAARGSKQRDCGFAQDISLSGLSAGTHKLSIWCESSSGAKGMFTANFTIREKDNQKPTISNVVRSNLNESSFLITCKVEDNIGVTDVNFAVWTEYAGQDDLKIHKGNISEDSNGKFAWCAISNTEHNLEIGNYNCDIYAYDATGNYDFVELRKIYVGNLIHFHSFTNENGGSLGISMEGNPTVKGRVKFWFIEYDIDPNYYINIWVDNTRVVYNSPSNAEGLIAYTVDTTKLSNGQHYIKAELFDSNTSFSTTKNFMVDNTPKTLTFNSNGGTCSTPSKTIYYNTPYGTLPTPTRTGYTFDGWYTSATGGTKITASSTVTTTANQTLYAHWSHTHSYTSTVTKEPTCTQPGTKTFKCSICGNTYTESIAATGHTPGKWITDKEATCKAEGSRHQVCTVCGETLKTETIVKKDHNIVTIHGIPATCTEDGKTEGIYCSVCGSVIKAQEVLPATGHTDADSNGICDTCGKELEHGQPSDSSCDCICHKTGFAGFIYKIIRVFWKLFRMNKTCSCGTAHY